MHRELCLRGSLSHLDGAFLLGFLWPVILLFLKLQSLPVYFLPILPYTNHNSFHFVAKHQGERDWRIISDAPQWPHLWLV